MAKVYVVEHGVSKMYVEYGGHDRYEDSDWIEGIFDYEPSAVSFMITKSMEKINTLVNSEYFVRPITSKNVKEGEAVYYAVTDPFGYTGCKYWMRYTSYDLQETKFEEGLA